MKECDFSFYLGDTENIRNANEAGMILNAKGGREIGSILDAVFNYL